MLAAIFHCADCPAMKTPAPGERDGKRRSMPWAAVALAAAAGMSQAQDGYYDPAWAASGRQMMDLGPLNDVGVALAIQRDGRLVLGGHCGFSGGRNTLCATRLRRDGQVDFSFGPNETGRILLNEHVDFQHYDSGFGGHALAVQPGGHVLMGGWWKCGNWAQCYAGLMVRLTPSGQVMPNPYNSQHSVSFSYDAAYHHNAVSAIAIAPDGKIVVAGDSNRAGSNPPNRDFGIARFNADLGPDWSFSGTGARLGAFDLGGDYFDSARAVAVQPDRKIVVGGFARGADGRLKAAVMRLNADGSSDQGFGNGGRVWFDAQQYSAGDVYIDAIAVDRRGRIVVAGTKQYLSTDHDFMVARLDAQGQLDSGFGSYGGVAVIPFDMGGSGYDTASDLALQSDGKIVVTGWATETSFSRLFAVARLGADGQLDASFGINGRGLGTFAPPTPTFDHYDAAGAVAIGNGGLMVAGHGLAQSGDYRFGIAKLRLDLVFTDGFQ